MYTYAATVPAGTTGTFSIGIQGYRNITLLPGTTKQQVARDIGKNQIINFSVDHSPIVPRRTVVATANCEGCHTTLAAHGGSRNQVEMCVLCHNPNTTDTNKPPTGVDFARHIHKIHTGENLTMDYTVGNRNYNGIRFPGDLRDCARCHVNGSEQLPLSAKLLPVIEPRSPIPVMGATTAACTGCHDSLPTASHALSNSNALGEACSVCHGTDDDFAVSKVHAR
jgi:OmcA/MtrC family decaheme c-type cytochrome